MVQATTLDQGLVVSEPLGVVLIIGAWCSPVQQALGPLVGAIAAGQWRPLLSFEQKTQDSLVLYLILAIFVVFREWANLVIVRAWHFL